MAFFRNISIRSALVLVMSLSILPALGIILYSGLELGQALEDRAHEEVLRQTRAFAEIQGNITVSTRGLLSSIVRLNEFVTQDVEGMKRILREIHIQNPQYVNFSFVDRDRIVVASSLLPSGETLRDRYHIEEAFFHRSFRIGNYTVAKVDGIPSLPFAIPVMDRNGTVVGVLSAVFRLDYYSSLYRQFSLPRDSYLSLIDREGTRVFFYPAYEGYTVGKKIRTDLFARMQGERSEGLFTERFEDDIERYIAWNALYSTGEETPYMYIVYASPLAASRRLVKAVLVRNSLLMLIAAAASLLLAFMLSGIAFGRRLKRIVTVADRIRSGDLSARVPGDDRSPDLGRISHSLNLMAETVETRHLDLEDNAERMSVLANQKEMLLRELNHRVKNNLQLILSLVNITPETSPAERPLRESLENRISAIALLHEMLHESDSPGAVDIFEYVQRISSLVLGEAIQAGDVECSVKGSPVEVSLDVAVPFGLVVNEILTNSLKYGKPQGEELARILVDLGQGEDGNLVVTIRDNGPGVLDAALRPDGSSGGIGLNLVDILMQQLKGEWTLESNGGALFRLALPLPPVS